MQGIGDLFAVAEAVLGTPGEQLRRASRIDLAESALVAPDASFGGVDFYDNPIDQAAILCSRIVRNHPLPDGNKRVGFLMMLQRLDERGLDFTHPDGDQDATADAIEHLAAGELDERAFRRWVRERVAFRASALEPENASQRHSAA